MLDLLACPGLFSFLMSYGVHPSHLGGGPGLWKVGRVDIYVKKVTLQTGQQPLQP